jgi:hypothetical protein
VPTVFGAAALAQFTPALEPVDGPFECRAPASDGVYAILGASVPSAAASRAELTVSVDSLGKIARYSERRGTSMRAVMRPGMTQAETAEAVRAANDTIQVTIIQLDFTKDQIMARNSGGHGPQEMVIAPIAGFENADNLGRPAERATRLLAACSGAK